MPTHLDVLCGHYNDVLLYNQKALATDRRFLACSDDPGVYLVYVIHNFHFAIYGAMFLGQYTPAIAAADELIATIPEAVLRIESPPMADFLEGYLTMKQHVLVRFGKWREIIEQKLPEDRDLYCSNVAMIHYARAVAHSALGSVAEAEAEKALFTAAKTRVPESRRVHNNKVVNLLDVAEAMLNGELEYRKGNYDNAFAHLRRSVELSDALPYDEPWGWMQPTRHALGALLLEQGQSRGGRGGLSFRSRLRRQAEPGLPASRQSVVAPRAARMPGSSRRKSRVSSDQAAARSRASAGGDPHQGIMLLSPNADDGRVRVPGLALNGPTRVA